MNRHERRRLASERRRGEYQVGRTIVIGVGRILECDQYYGIPVNCYVCSTPHAASHLARIKDRGHTLDVPLCPHCATTNQTAEYTGLPDIEIAEGGDVVSAEQLDGIAAALAEREAASQH
jgi:hypothetical protein